MFRSKKIKTEWVNPTEFKDWSDAGPEIERLGRQLDAVRNSLSFVEEDTWAYTHWKVVESILVRKWQLMITMQQTGMRQEGPSRGPDVSYNWWERDGAPGIFIPGFSLISEWLEEIVSQPRIEKGLAESWENARNKELQKARQGLA